jgi:hypothetical protein
MRHTVRRFDSHTDAEAAHREYYRSLTPQQHLDLLVELVYGNRDPNDLASERLERVCRIVPFSQDNATPRQARS